MTKESTWDSRDPVADHSDPVASTLVSLIGWVVFRSLYRPNNALIQRIGNFVTLPKEEQARLRCEEVAAALTAGDARTTDCWSMKRFEEEVELAA